ncbi:zinc finger protein 614-like isoform X2 [Rhagoletis pomonella]|uniref:zinc finger protein 614-like isoform X2 n=1 Tax=Rhagoletis pomonella TaxID=28610 RepID=UPI00178146EB|nr:zinc finger protein 614-like isoform X2 [Rhagoletis pomonella]
MDSINICRACLSREDQVHLLDWNQPISSLETELTYKECFCKCTQINVSLKDDQNERDEAQMQYLCCECAHKLEEAHGFIEKARKSDNELRCIRPEKVKLENGMANTFEWVPVEVKELKNNLTEVEIKNCVEDPKNALEWSENYIDDFETAISNDIGHDENVKSESDEPVSNKVDRPSVAHKKLKNVRKRSYVTKKSSKGIDEIVTCEKCGKTMTRKALRKHKYIHKPKIYLCQACPRKFNDERALRKHEETHKEHRERYPCDKCGRSFASPYYLQTHLQTHENNRKPMFHCKQCDKSFLNKSGLSIHELHHKGITIECNICQKRYVRQVDLEAHLRTHSGESPFVCRVCNKSFSQKRILNRHMQYHKGYTSYTCLTCGEKFSKYDKYYTHRMQHTGLPYKCGSCEKKFEDSYKTKRHIRGVHKIQQDEEVEKLVVRINVTKEYRGRIVEFLRKTEDEPPA